MQYIVVDLEWNQPLSRLSSAFRRVGDRLMFEMIQIGAVKLDAQRRMIGSFSSLITPQYYLKLHPRIRRITGITQEDLADAPTFHEALERFAAWCGEDAVLLTWGSDDISVFQQNLDFFKSKRSLPPFYDLQKLYAQQHEEGKLHRGLQAALNYYEIMATDEHPFHSAVDDAYYTALVFQRFPEAEAVLKHPEQARPLGRAKSSQREKSEDLSVRGEKSYLGSAGAKKVACPVCGKTCQVKEGYVPVRKVQTALADCADHGLLIVEIAFTRDENKKLLARRTVSLSDEQSPAYVATKHLQWAGKVASLLADEVAS
ncbi:MAG: exonuclease domain-containing protein [Christensenellales bacterium]